MGSVKYRRSSDVRAHLDFHMSLVLHTHLCFLGLKRKARYAFVSEKRRSIVSYINSPLHCAAIVVAVLSAVWDSAAVDSLGGPAGMGPETGSLLRYSQEVATDDRRVRGSRAALPAGKIVLEVGLARGAAHESSTC